MMLLSSMGGSPFSKKYPLMGYSVKSRQLVAWLDKFFLQRGGQPVNGYAPFPFSQNRLAPMSG